MVNSRIKSNSGAIEVPKIGNKIEPPATKRISEIIRGLFIESASQPNKTVEVKPRKAKALSRNVACCGLMPFQIIIGMKWVEIA